MVRHVILNGVVGVKLMIEARGSSKRTVGSLGVSGGCQPAEEDQIGRGSRTCSLDLRRHACGMIALTVLSSFQQGAVFGLGGLGALPLLLAQDSRLL